MTEEFPSYWERLVAFASEGKLGEEIRLARSQYFAQSGELHDDEPSFERRIEGFTEWYVFDYLVTDTKRSPLDLFLASQRGQISAAEIAVYEAMRGSRRSLFEYLKSKGSALWVRDLSSQTKLLVVELSPLVAVDKGDIIDARLVTFRGQTLCTASPIIHPADMRRPITKLVKQVRKKRPQDFDALRSALSLARLRCDRYRGVVNLRLYRQALAETGFEI